MIAQFNQLLAKETEDLCLEAGCIQAGVAAVLKVTKYEVFELELPGRNGVER